MTRPEHPRFATHHPVIEHVILYYNLISYLRADIIDICRSFPRPGQEVIRMPDTAFASAAGMLDASLDHLAATDWAPLGTAAHGEMLARLQRAQAKLTAVNAAVLSAFTAQSGFEPDGHRSARAWLINKTGIAKGAASGAVAWQKRLARHRRIAAVMAAGASPSPGPGRSPPGPTSCPRRSGTRPTPSCWTPPSAGCRWRTWRSSPAPSPRPGRPSTPIPTTATATGMRGMRTGSRTGTCASGPRSAGRGRPRGT